jgi:hypothetical protein
MVLRKRRKTQEDILIRTVTELHRGTWSERKLVLGLLKYGIPASTIFHDLYLEKYNGSYSQIDVVVATKVGIIVFEVKDYSGWIFGKGYQSYWTQVLAYGREKYRFYNPVMQNNGHINVLKNRLKQYAEVPFYSVVVFYGDCILRDVSSIPDGTFLISSKGLPHLVNSILESNPPANYTSKVGVINRLKDAVNNGNNQEIQIQHIRNIQSMTKD